MGPFPLFVALLDFNPPNVTDDRSLRHARKIKGTCMFCGWEGNRRSDGVALVYPPTGSMP